MLGARLFKLPADRRWQKRLAFALAIALGLGWLPTLFYGHTSLGRLVAIRAELAALKRKNRGLLDENQRLRAAIQLHDEDPLGALERVARDDLGLVKPGEIVFHIVESNPEASSQGPR